MALNALVDLFCHNQKKCGTEKVNSNVATRAMYVINIYHMHVSSERFIGTLRQINIAHKSIPEKHKFMTMSDKPQQRFRQYKPHTALIQVTVIRAVPK